MLRWFRPSSASNFECVDTLSSVISVNPVNGEETAASLSLDFSVIITNVHVMMKQE